MKNLNRVLSVFLAGIILASSVHLSISAQTDIPEFENPDIWKIYKTGEAVGSECEPSDISWASISVNSDKQYIADGESSLLFKAISQWSVIVLDVKQNTNYTINFSYYSDTLGDSSEIEDNDAIIKEMCVIEDNSVPAWNSDNNLAYRSYNLAYTGPYSNRVNSGERTTVTETGWHNVSFAFNSGENAKVVFCLKSFVNDLYIDNFNVYELLSDKMLQNFEDADDAKDIVYRRTTMTGEVTSVIKNGCSETGNGQKVLELPQKAGSADEFSYFLAQQPNCWTPDSASSLNAGAYKISFDIKAEWSDATTALAYIHIAFESSDIRGRMRANEQLADGLEGLFSVSELEDGWKRYTIVAVGADAGAFRFIGFNNMTTDTAISIDNIVIETIENMITTGNSASLRSAYNDKPKGMRIKSTIGTDALNKCDIVEYGTIVTLAQYANGAELTADSTFTKTFGVAYDKDNDIEILFDDDGNIKTFTGVLINVPAKHYGSDFIIRAYAKGANGTYHYGQSLSCSIFDVVYAILNTEDAPQADIDTANSYISEAAALNDPSLTYEAWKTSNGK